MKILGSMTIRMTKKDQRKIGAFFQKTAIGGSGAMICEARVFSPYLSGVWRMDPEWKVAILDHELYDKINALLIEAQPKPLLPKTHEHRGEKL